MRRLLLGLAVIFQAGLGASGALAAWPKGSDPSSNYAPRIPQGCYAAPHGTKCLKAALHYLNRARAHLRQAPYKLPGNFLKLAADQQLFILTDLDRAVYNLSPVEGVTAQLNRNAMAGVRDDEDPGSGDPGFTNYPKFQYFTSNWAYGYPNLLFAYGSWMYDDGYGSPNIDCKSPGAAGCWGHRHDILWEFPKEYDLDGPTAMGAAAGKDHSGQPSYAMLLGRGDTGYKPKYLYQWSDRGAWW